MGWPVQCVLLLGTVDQACRDALAARLRGEDVTLVDATSVAAVIAQVAAVRPAVVLIGASCTDEDRLEDLARQLRGCHRDLRLSVLAEEESEALAVAALRAGVDDYVRAPWSVDALVSSIRRCLMRGPSRQPPRRVEPDLRVHGGQTLIGNSRVMRTVRDYLVRLAQNDTTVLITGETGTGKELAATRIHALSSRTRARFVSINCAAIPDGLLESELFGHESGAFTGAVRAREGLLQAANGGTVFLDEVGDLGPAAQAKLLRAIETREVHRLGSKRPEKLDVRIVAATNQDLERAVEEGRFRKDLYFRVNVARIRLPPLREHPSDIPSLLDHHLQMFNRWSAAQVAGFGDEVVAALRSYEWPGNVRELKNLVETIFVCPAAGRVEMAHLPEEFRRRLAQARGVPDHERRRLIDALLSTNGNKSRAAGVLQCSRMTLYRKMAKYAIASDGRVA
jgi:DNA-binding NtrC family response regulator